MKTDKLEQMMQHTKLVDINLILLKMEQLGLLPSTEEKKKLLKIMLEHVDDTHGFLDSLNAFNR